ATTLTICNYNPAYKNGTELPDGGFRVIRFFRYSNISGSVPRPRNKQSGNICCRAAGHGAGEEHNI
ncbi:hypothetical protein ACFERR_004883, partial [Salmonella enterica]